MNIPQIDNKANGKKKINRRRKRHAFMRRLLNLPIVPQNLVEKIWDVKNLEWDKTPDSDLEGNLSNPISELKYLYWWEITQSEVLYKQERRIRGLVILFGNSCYALFGLSLYLWFMGSFEVGLLCLIGSGFCFFAYTRYRYYRLRHIHIYGYYHRKNRL